MIWQRTVESSPQYTIYANRPQFFKQNAMRHSVKSFADVKIDLSAEENYVMI